MPTLDTVGLKAADRVSAYVSQSVLSAELLTLTYLRVSLIMA